MIYGKLIQIHLHTCVSFSCFLKLLNLKKPSLSLRDGLFLTEPWAFAGDGQGIGFKGEVDGNLGEKDKDIDYVYMYTAVYFNVLHLRRQAFFLVSFTKHNQPVQCIVVLQILCSPATLHIFNHMVLQKLFEELHCLLPCDIWAKVAVVAKQLVEPVHRS